MGRKRKNTNDNRLPSYVYKSKGRYIHKPYLGRENGKTRWGPEIVLALADASMSEIWKAYEAIQGAPQYTLKWLANQYLESQKFADLADSTRKSYRECHNQVMNTPLQDKQTFGDCAHEIITPGAIRKYLDRRSRDAPVRANREVAYLSAVFSWAYERDMTKLNPCRGVKRITEKARDNYIEDDDYYGVYDLAEASPWYIQPAMEIAYLCRMRKIEVLTAKKDQILEAGLDTIRRKGSKDFVTQWSERLAHAVRTAVDRNRRVDSIYIFSDECGQPIKVSTFNTAWQRLAIKAAKQGLSRFPYHDIKAKGVSDFEGTDLKKASGHKTDAMVARYDRKKRKVEPTR